MPQLIRVGIGLGRVGFDKLALFGRSKLSRLRPDSVLPALDAMFPLISGGGIPESVRKALHVADEFLRTLEPRDGSISDNPDQSPSKLLRPLIQEFYKHLIGRGKVIGEIHSLPDREAQVERLGNEFERFCEAFLNEQARRKQDIAPEQLENARNSMSLMGGILGLFGYPGIGEVGIPF